MMYNSQQPQQQQQVPYASPAAQLGAYTPSVNAAQGYAPQQSPAPGLPAQAVNYVPHGSPYSTQAKLLPGQNNAYPQQQQPGYNSPAWGYDKPNAAVVPQLHHQQLPQQYQQQQVHQQQQQQPAQMPVQKQQPTGPMHQQQQHSIHSQLPAYNHQDYPNTVASSASSSSSSSIHAAVLAAQSRHHTQSIKAEPAVNHSADLLNHRAVRNHKPVYKEESGSEEESSSTARGAPEEPDYAVPDDAKPIKTPIKGQRIKAADEAASRKRKSTGDPPAESGEGGPAPPKQRKIKRLERKVATCDEFNKMSIEELMETNTFQRFTRLVENVFDATEDADLNALQDVDPDADVPPEAMIPKQQLHDLCAEAAKLKVSCSNSFRSPRVRDRTELGTKHYKFIVSSQWGPCLQSHRRGLSVF